MDIITALDSVRLGAVRKSRTAEILFGERDGKTCTFHRVNHRWYWVHVASHGQAAFIESPSDNQEYTGMPVPDDWTELLDLAFANPS
jgi:hypothetical protein